MPVPHEPLDLTVWYDYHCPYSYRAVAWLIGLAADRAGPGDGPRIQPRFRPFPLEQVNRDPTASTWRLWDQPLDYVHYRERRDRRPLQAFLATALLESAEPTDLVDRFRLSVYRARFEAGADISDVDLLVRLAGDAGADARRLAGALADEGALVEARAGLATAWSDARSEYEIFGVPTIQPAGERPFYLRLEAPVATDGAAVLLERLLALRRTAPDVVEIKLPERVEPANGS